MLFWQPPAEALSRPQPLYTSDAGRIARQTGKSLALRAVILIPVDLSEELLELLRESIHFASSVVQTLPAKKSQSDVT
jgi:hypothetical protein